MVRRVQVYCDGSCPKPHGPGGWAFIILIGEYISKSGFARIATNQTMELAAALEALREIRARALSRMPLTIISDSQYLVKGMTIWRAGWEAQDYAGISNVEWWKLLHRHQDHCTDLRFEWVKGHGSSKWNKLVDERAGEARKNGLARI
jgi:ribonuclease HI